MGHVWYRVLVAVIWQCGRFAGRVTEPHLLRPLRGHVAEPTTEFREGQVHGRSCVSNCHSWLSLNFSRVVLESCKGPRLGHGGPRASRPASTARRLRALLHVACIAALTARFSLSLSSPLTLSAESLPHMLMCSCWSWFCFLLLGTLYKTARHRHRLPAPLFFAHCKAARLLVPACFLHGS